MNMQWSMMPPTLYASWVPMWVEILITVLLVAGGIITLIGSLGLLRMNDFFQRLHGPSMGNTLGSMCILLGSLLFFSFSRHELVFHEVLILLFVLLTAPVVGMLLARAALYRKQGVALSAQVNARNGAPDAGPARSSAADALAQAAVARADPPAPDAGAADSHHPSRRPE